MPTYVSLFNYTDQGVKSFKETVSRARAAEAAMAKSGLTMKALYWTQGQYDLVSVVEAPDEETATAFLLSLGAQGNIRSNTLRAFSAEEMERIIAKAG